MILFKIIQQFFFPSTIIFVLILLGFILSLKRKKIGRILMIFGIAFYYLFSITPFSDLILFPLENKYEAIGESDLGESDKIVLLSGGVKASQIFGGASLLEESTLYRASEALRIYILENEKIAKDCLAEPCGSGSAKIIISGTSPLNSEEKEADKIKEFLMELGVEEDNLILDNKSRNTEESAKNLKELLKDEPFFLVTSAYHMRRSILLFEKYGLHPIPAPGDFKIEKNYVLFDFFPNPKNLRKVDLAAHEYLGIIYYTLL